MTALAEQRSFIATLKQFMRREVLILLLLGFSAGLPILLIFSTLSLWLREAGVERSAVTFFSWAALGYSFKFIWAPLVDKLPIPGLSGLLGRRRSWLLLAQCAVVGSIVWMAAVNPQQGLAMMALAAVALGFSSATQDIVIDAYRIECANKDMQALLSSSYIAGYRIGMVVAGAGSLYLADMLGSGQGSYSYSAWQTTYWVMAACMLVGIATTLLIREPSADNDNPYPYSAEHYLRFFALSVGAVIVFILAWRIFPALQTDLEGYSKTLLGFAWGTAKMLSCLLLAAVTVVAGVKLNAADRQLVVESYWLPVKDFLQKYGRLAIWVLLLVGFYRVSDIVMGVVANVFYQDMGFTKTQIASVTKVFGLLMTILGSFIGGFFALKIGVMRVLLVGAVLAAVTNLLFMVLAKTEPTLELLTLVIAADNLAAGLAVAAFVAWLSSLTSISFTATQYAIFSSLMTLFPKLMGGYSGTLVDTVGYAAFFQITALIGLPVIGLILYLGKQKL